MECCRVSPLTDLSDDPKDSSVDRDTNKMALRHITCLRILNRLAQSLAVLVLFIILLVQAFKCVEKYMREPTFVSTKIVEQRESEFPAVTICSMDNGYKEDVMAVSFFLFWIVRLFVWRMTRFDEARATIFIATSYIMEEKGQTRTLSHPPPIFKGSGNIVIVWVRLGSWH